MRRTPAHLNSLAVDGLVFAVRWSTRRSIGISVARDGSLKVAAPVGASADTLTKAVRSKLPWIHRKLDEFKALGPPPQPKRLLEGERLSYLGREHRLVVVDGPRKPVGLTKGRFELDRALSADERRAALVAWYTQRAAPRLADRVNHYAPLLDVTPGEIVVRDLGSRRWATCHSRAGTLSFHWRLILQPLALIDYVVVHELAHLLEPNHSRRFWRHVERILPDYRARRAQLSTLGEHHTL